MKKIFFLSLVFLAIGVASCSKDQKAVKQLEGTWEVTTQDGVAIPDSSKYTIKFDFCKLKKDNYCSYTQTDADGYSYTGDYKVIDKGTMLVQAVVDTSKGNIELTSKIDELTDSKLKLTLDFAGFQTTTEYDKK